jgi:hypothetical protein
VQIDSDAGEIRLMNHSRRNKQRADTDRRQRIIDLWLERPRSARTADDVFPFYGWLTHHAPDLLRAAAGSSRKLLDIVAPHIVNQGRHGR